MFVGGYVTCFTCRNLFHLYLFVGNNTDVCFSVHGDCPGNTGGVEVILLVVHGHKGKGQRIPDTHTRCDFLGNNISVGTIGNHSHIIHQTYAIVGYVGAYKDILLMAFLWNHRYPVRKSPGDPVGKRTAGHPVGHKVTGFITSNC